MAGWISNTYSDHCKTRKKYDSILCRGFTFICWCCKACINCPWLTFLHYWMLAWKTSVAVWRSSGHFGQNEVARLRWLKLLLRVSVVPEIYQSPLPSGLAGIELEADDILMICCVRSGRRGRTGPWEQLACSHKVLWSSDWMNASCILSSRLCSLYGHTMSLKAWNGDKENIGYVGIANPGGFCNVSCKILAKDFWNLWAVLQDPGRG